VIFTIYILFSKRAGKHIFIYTVAGVTVTVQLVVYSSR
jgi:hypothetical protein